MRGGLKENLAHLLAAVSNLPLWAILHIIAACLLGKKGAFFYNPRYDIPAWIPYYLLYACTLSPAPDNNLLCTSHKRL